MGVRSGVRTQVLCCEKPTRRQVGGGREGGSGPLWFGPIPFFYNFFGGYLGAYIYVAILDQVAKYISNLAILLKAPAQARIA